VITDSRLLLFANNVSREALGRFVPPGTWAQRKRFPEWHRVPENSLAARIKIPFAPGHDRQWVIPCFSASVASPFTYRFTARAELPDGTRTRWRSVSRIGASPDEVVPPGEGTDIGPVFNAVIGAFFIKRKIRCLHMRVTVSTSDARELAQAPSVISISLSPNAPRLGPGSVRGTFPVDIPVPGRSQMVERASLRSRICAPTNVAMVMDFFGLDANTGDVAARAYHAATDRYGVWQENIRAASGWGFLGYVGRFPSWYEACSLLRQAVPIIASIRYGAGQLEGSPLTSTDGHLVTICGFSNSRVRVNDPAGISSKDVSREYRVEQFQSAWFGSGGVGLVLFPAKYCLSRK